MVTEKIGDRDEQVTKQCFEFVGAVAEKRKVTRQLADLAQLHAARHTAHQSRPPILGKVMASAKPQQLQDFKQRGRISRLNRLFMFRKLHSMSSLRQATQLLRQDAHRKHEIDQSTVDRIAWHFRILGFGGILSNNEAAGFFNPPQPKSAIRTST